ncbi:MAG: hypothetical protein AB7E30_04595 [Lawsonibacter sp.]
MQEPIWSHLLYWGSLSPVLIAGGAVISYGLLPFTRELDGLFLLGLFFLHLAAGHWFGYRGMLKRKYHAVPWRRAYQRCLTLTFGLVGLGWIAASLLPQGVGIYAVILTIVIGLLYSNRRLGQLQHQDTAPHDYNTKE